MNPTRIPTTGNTTPSLNDHSHAQRSKFKKLPAPVHHEPDSRNWALEWADSGELAPHSCACAETENLPRIILVSGDGSLMPELHRALDPCPLEIRTVGSCLEAGREIGDCRTADVVFTDIQLPDGNWKQVLQMAGRIPTRVEVILVSRFVDVRLYLDALEAGAFDFVVPPFQTVEIGYIVVNAIYACFKQGSHGFSGNIPGATAV